MRLLWEWLKAFLKWNLVSKTAFFKAEMLKDAGKLTWRCHVDIKQGYNKDTNSPVPNPGTPWGLCALGLGFLNSQIHQFQILLHLILNQLWTVESGKCELEICCGASIHDGSFNCGYSFTVVSGQLGGWWSLTSLMKNSLSLESCSNLFDLT